MFTLTIDETTMNFQPISVTHVELSSSFIKIHGQTNREKVKSIGYELIAADKIFALQPRPVIKMLRGDCMVLVYYNTNYFRGRFISAGVEETANVLLIDMGNTVTVEMANVR